MKAGDTNIDLIKSSIHSITSEFINMLTSFGGMLPTVTRPTRITCDSATLIDNICINCYNCAYVSRIICAGMSDHCPTYISVDLHVQWSILHNQRNINEVSIKKNLILFKEKTQNNHMEWFC